ncbi:hypothetical protein Hanom_Chr12g01103191 [Helianthus anomalus]
MGGKGMVPRSCLWHSPIGLTNLRFYPALKLRFCHQFKIMFFPRLKINLRFRSQVNISILPLVKNYDFAPFQFTVLLLVYYL